MPLTVPHCDKTLVAISADDTRLRITNTQAQVCSEFAVAGGAHMTATIYTATKSERVLITGCENYPSGSAVSYLTVTRGFEGSTAQSWPADACFKIDAVIPGEVCPDAEGKSGNSCPNPASVFSSLAVCDGLVLDLSDPLVPRLCLADTGLVTTNICGATFDNYGRLIHAPLNWPSTCLPTFDPCCDTGGGGGGGGDLCDMTFSPQGAGIVTATNICDAVNQLEDAIIAGTSGGVGVTSVTAGTGVTVSGTSSDPIVAITPTGVAAGTYAGFAVNALGQITGYTPVAAGGPSFAGTAPVNVAYSGLSDTYTISINQATVTDLGVVRLVDAANASTTANHNLIPGDSVVTWDALLAAAAALAWA